jgi:hypothetical protein
MTITRNPFDVGGYSLADMTQAINILPNLYTRLGQIGLFRFEGVSQRSIVIEQREGVLSLLPSVPLGAPATTLYNYFTEFGLAQISVDFVFGTAGTNVQSKVRTTLRAIEDNLLGETMITAHALVSSEFFDKLISHPKTEEAYKFFSATGGQPLREDMRRAFPFAGMLFEEYNGSVTLSNGTSERLIPTGEGIAFPMGTFDTFTTYGGPANLLETANTIGLPLYARQMVDAKGRWIDLMTEASILPVNKRPRLAIRLFSAN